VGMSSFVFVLDDPSQDPLFQTLKYDADNQTLSGGLVTWPRTFTSVEGDPTYGTITVKGVERLRRTYVATNGFGASREITEIHGDDYGVVLTTASKIILEDGLKYNGQHTPSFSLTLSLDRAKALKANLRLAIVCALNDPRVLKTVKFESATLSSPYQINWNESYISVSLEQLLLFDSKTGEVLTRVLGN
jgi:hypothetical protein